MSLINLFQAIAQRFYFLKLWACKNNPKIKQLKILAKILKDNKNTDFGRKYQFEQLDCYEQFRSKVPLQNSQEYQAWSATVYQGQSDAVVKQQPQFFAMTAGSTGNYKYIPVNKLFRQEVNQSVYAYHYFLTSCYPELKQGVIQFIVSSAEGGTSPSGIPQGFMSGFNYTHLPKLIKDRFIVPYWVFTLIDAEQRNYTICRYLISNRQVKAIAAFSPQSIINIFKAALNNISRLSADVDKGTLGISCLPNGAEVRFEPQPKLATKIEKCHQYFQNDSQKLLTVLFPQLSYYLTWQGGNMGYLLNKLQQMAGSKQIISMPYSASEGVFSIPYKTNQSSGIAAVTSHFLEYIPETAINDNQAEVLPVWQLKVGEYYYQVVTNSSGLYRYNMEDLVKVTGMWGKIPVVKFISKKHRQTSIQNERLNEHQVTQAMLYTCQTLAINISQFIFFPSNQGHYKVVVSAVSGCLQTLANLLERQLLLQSKGYAFERADKLLSPLEVLMADESQLNNYLTNNLRHSDIPNEQIKPLYLSPEFEGHKRFTAYQSAKSEEVELSFFDS